MRSGTTIEKAGVYKCLFHKKNKQKFYNVGEPFPRCDFAGIKCHGEWFLLKEIREKTLEEKMIAHNRRLESSDKAKARKRIKGWLEQQRQQEEINWWKDRW
jgi:hypothetical protein